MPLQVSHKLISSDENIVYKFKSMVDFEDVANLLEIPQEFLWKILIKNKGKNYRTFKLKKKSGGERVINAPENNLSIIQKKLAYILSINYKKHHPSSHGFVPNRSIITNASQHTGKKFVLNLDLDNFFGSITFGRVRAMLMSYYKFNNSVASTLANICCNDKGVLPQGAATSPIISNIISRKLDEDLFRLAKQRKCTYSRYADDITFSTNKDSFPQEIAFMDGPMTIISSQVENLIKKNGFSINDKKSRLRNLSESQSVTGITVNQKTNVNRQYIRKIRSILNCIEKNIDDVSKAETIFREKYNFRQTLNKEPNMFDVLRGMISHVGHVKSKDDMVFLKLAKRFNKLIKEQNLAFIRIPINDIRLREENTFVIESLSNTYSFEGEDEEALAYNDQGTGFLLRNIGLVTNAHVLKENIEVLEYGAQFKKEYYIEIHKSKYSMRRYFAKIDYYDSFRDIAILTIRDLDITKFGFDYNKNIACEQDIKLIGYPEFRNGQDLRVLPGTVMGKRNNTDNRRNQERYEISASIFAGNSGGPVINSDNEVIAVAVRGFTENGVVPNEVIPISDVINIFENKTRQLYQASHTK
ncbi:reverse transcriptase domain-containing protein [Priestia sp. D3YE.R1]|uniref:reverse transcriptase domain-containing protein n=1 Tax=Priestia sp. D3YE.R1 TaxID=3400416 RepID=UPI003BA31B25